MNRQKMEKVLQHLHMLDKVATKLKAGMNIKDKEDVGTLMRGYIDEILAELGVEVRDDDHLEEIVEYLDDYLLQEITFGEMVGFILDSETCDEEEVATDSIPGFSTYIDNKTKQEINSIVNIMKAFYGIPL